MNRKIILLFISLFLVVGLISALEVKKTEFIIKTEPYQNLSVSVLNANKKEQVELFEGRARKFGEFRFEYYGTIDKVNLLISILNNETGETIKKKELGPYDLGLPTVSLDFYLLEKEISESVAEEEVIDKLNASSDSDDENSLEGGRSVIQGLIIGENFQFLNKYYYIGVIVLGVIILVFVLKKHFIVALKSGSPSEPHPTEVIKSKDSKPSKTEVPMQSVQQKSKETSINETEKKIGDLQRQLEEIRNEEKLLKLQKQINQEKQSLREMQDDVESKFISPPSNQDNSQNIKNNNKETKTF